MRQFMGQSEPTFLTNANADSEWTTAAFLDYFSFPFTEWYTHESYYFVLILTTMTIKNVASLWWLDVENRHHIKSCGELPSMFRKTVRAANLHHTSFPTYTLHNTLLSTDPAAVSTLAVDGGVGDLLFCEERYRGQTMSFRKKPIANPICDKYMKTAWHHFVF